MSIKELLLEAKAIQVAVTEPDWKKVITMAAQPLINNGYINESYSQAIIDNTLDLGAYYVFDEGIAIPHARPECGVIKNGFSMVLLNKAIRFQDSEKADIIIMFGATDGNSHIQDGIQAIIELLDNKDRLAKLRAATSWRQVVEVL